jgi:hypothetical protein
MLVFGKKQFFTDLSGINWAQHAAAGTSMELLPREMAQGGVDAGATVIDFYKGHPDFPNKLVMYDNGKGISSPEVLVERLSKPNAQPVLSRHFGIGLRVLAIKAAPARAYTGTDPNPYPYLVFITQGKYGPAHKLEAYLNGYRVTQEERFPGGSGSYTIITGSGKDVNTELIGGRTLTWVDRALNSRYVRSPKGVTIYVKGNKGTDGTKRCTVAGLLGLLDKGGSTLLGDSVVDGFRVIVYRLYAPVLSKKAELSTHSNYKPTRATDGNGIVIAGQVLHTLDNEIYSMELGANTPCERLRVTGSVKSQLLFLIEPLDTKIYVSNMTRQGITKINKSGEYTETEPALDLRKLFEVYRENAPREVKNFLNKEAATDSKRVQYSKDVNFIERKLRIFGDFWIKSTKGTLQHLKDAVAPSGMEKGLPPSSPPRPPNPDLDPRPMGEGPFPSLRPTDTGNGGEPGLTTKKPSKDNRIRAIAKEVAPDVIISLIDGDPDSFAFHYTGKVGNNYGVDLILNSTQLDVMLALPIAKAKGIVRDQLTQQLVTEGALKLLMPFAYSELYGKPKMVEDEALSAAMLDPTIFGRIRSKDDVQEGDVGSI